MKLIDLIDDMEVKKWVLIFCILGVSFTDNVGDIKLAEVFSNKNLSSTYKCNFLGADNKQ